MKFWVARDRTGLWLYTTKPIFYHNRNEFDAENGDTFYIDEDMFPEVTFENSPQQVEIKLIK